MESDIEILRRAAVAGGDTAALAMAEGQLQGLSNLQRRIEHAGPGALAAIRAEVVAFIAASQATSQLTRTATATAQNAEVALHAASAAAHRVVEDFNRDFYERKIFDPYLKFGSAEDEATYRKREAETQRYIAEQIAKGTPQGNLNAAGAMVGQMNDAGAHGADASPDFKAKKAEADKAYNDLKHAATAAGISTAEADKRAASAADGKTETVVASHSGNPEIDAIAAQLRAAGISSTPTETKGHGVTKHATATTPAGLGV